MKRILLILTALVFLLAQQCNIFALAPWQDGKNHCDQLVKESGEGFIIDNHLAFIMPAKGGFNSSFARQVFNRYSIAKDLFSRAINYYSLTEEEFFTLFDSDSSEIELSVNQSKQKKIKEWGALITFYVTLYRVQDEQYGVSIRPFGIMGNSLGIFAAFIAADALDLEDGLNLFHKFCEVSLKTAGKKSFYMMRVFGVPLSEVERLVSSPGLVEVYHVHHRTHLQLTEEISLMGDEQALETARNKIEEAYGSGRVEMMGIDHFAPFHTPILREGSEELKKYVSSMKIKTPKTRIFSSNPDKGVLETVEDIREEIVYTLSHPVRWDKMVKNAAVEDINKFIVLGRKGGILKRVLHKGAQEVELIPLGDIESIRQTKSYILHSLGALEKFETPEDLFGFIYYLVLNGAKRFSFDGFSGAGKSVFIEGLADYLKMKGYNVAILHAGEFIKGGKLQSLRRTFKLARGLPKVSLSLKDLINYDQFLEFMKKVQAIHSGSAGSAMIHLSNLYDEATLSNQAELDVRITADTILIFEGNLFINEISEPWLDVTFFADLDLTTDLDLERILERARKRGKSGIDKERYYGDDARFYRRPLVKLHRETNIGFFDFFFDNTDFTHPVLVQNPIRARPSFNLKALMSSYQTWRMFSAPAPREQLNSTPEIDGSV